MPGASASADTSSAGCGVQSCGGPDPRVPAPRPAVCTASFATEKTMTENTAMGGNASSVDTGYRRGLAGTLLMKHFGTRLRRDGERVEMEWPASKGVSPLDEDSRERTRTTRATTGFTKEKHSPAGAVSVLTNWRTGELSWLLVSGSVFLHTLRS